MSTKTFIVKASDEAKKKKMCSSKNTNKVLYRADMVNCEDDLTNDKFEYQEIVLFVDGNLKYQGDPYEVECRETFENLCKDEKICEMFYEFCNSFGDPLLNSFNSPKDVGDTTWQIILGDYEMGADFYEDFTSDFQWGFPRVECFLSDDIIE